MTLDITYAIAISLYALFAYAITLTAFSILPMPAEPSRALILAKRVWIAGITVALILVPGVMQLLLAAHPVYYSVGVVLILFKLLRKGDPLKCMFSMTLLVSTLILSGCLQRHQAEILGYVRHAIAQPGFLGL